MGPGNRGGAAHAAGGARLTTGLHVGAGEWPSTEALRCFQGGDAALGRISTELGRCRSGLGCILAEPTSARAGQGSSEECRTCAARSAGALASGTSVRKGSMEECRTWPARRSVTLPISACASASLPEATGTGG